MNVLSKPLEERVRNCAASVSVADWQARLLNEDSRESVLGFPPEAAIWQKQSG
jgi:hypothetical protein